MLVGDEGLDQPVVMRTITLIGEKIFLNPKDVKIGPVPASSYLNIKYGIRDAEITIKIFSSTGILVKTIKPNKGEEKVTWNLKNEKDKIVCSGVYIIYIEAKKGNRIDRIKRKITIVR